ncbi:hypothetical protein A6V36_29790 [Paraburkholderia ginsengiterrae]|uniref:Uncharacterized protein n=1 Tax=Paraburkholderia ginsengiterrae TaxID=1462993 RepID=A0A1A9NB49_9BURK|nr:hypothetical protein [Paraburkholderia ginsengiterrae]OAJ58752.1 hypothetical protein A6V36_29790 [Paraburkholderia ginsengiterrae]OAJ63606.1 hypothetical protein A6V37_19925 [Paraburkholderia ginsengiterrae]
MPTAVELDPDLAWKDGPDTGLRSRYTGYPLKPGEMVITIVSQGTFVLGHQVIVFEWGHGFESTASYRKHKAFHLYPVRGQSAAPHELGLTGSAWNVVDGRIERLRAMVPKHSDGTSRGPEFAASELAATESDFMKGAQYRSWKVDFSEGWKAFEEAKKQWKNADLTPKFNLIGSFGGQSCGTWVQAIASIAGIPSTSWAAKLGFPIPAWEVYNCQEVKSETEMWDSRKKQTA